MKHPELASLVIQQHDLLVQAIQPQNNRQTYKHQLDQWLKPDWEPALNIHREAYLGRMLACVGPLFDPVYKAIGSEHADQLILSYLTQHPPTSSILEDSLESFPRFLINLNPHHQPLADLCSICLEVRKVLYGPDPIDRPFVLDDHASLTPDHQLLQLQTQSATWYNELLLNRSRDQVADQQEICLIYKSSFNQVNVKVIPAPLGEWISELSKGATLSEGLSNLSKPIKMEAAAISDFFSQIRTAFQSNASMVK